MNKKPEYPRTIFAIQEHFIDFEINLTEDFDIIICAESIEQSVTTTGTIICNLEDIKVMKQIANGDYSELDVNNASIFNDSYYEMCEFLNI